MLRLCVGFLLGVAATFCFYHYGYADRLAGRVRQAEQFGRELLQFDPAVRGQVQEAAASAKEFSGRAVAGVKAWVAPIPAQGAAEPTK